MLLRAHCPLQSRASATWSAVFKLREIIFLHSKTPFCLKNRNSQLLSLAFRRTPHETIFFSSLPTPCSPKVFPHTRTTKPPQTIPLLPPCCFTYCTRSGHLTPEAAHSQTGHHAQAQTLRALQPLMDHQWSLIHQIVGKFTPITLKPSLFMHLAAGLWVAYHCLQPLMSISLMKPLLTTILYQDSHCA